MSIMYRYPQLYDLAVRIVHGTSLKKRFEVISQEIGANKKVFELGCGTAMVYPFLHKGCAYEGWDLNERFLAMARKRSDTVKAFNKNIFDFDSYPDNDVILICDVLHHVAPKHQMLVKEALKRTKKLIVSEPARSFKPPRILSPIVRLFTKVLGDDDGINDPFQTLAWDYNEEKLRTLFQSMGCSKTITVGWDMIAVFDSNCTR